MEDEVIALVSCVKSKKHGVAPAKDLYISPLFRMMRVYAERHADRWFILSAKYGLVSPHEVLEPYEQTLTGARVAVRREWATRVHAQMQDAGILRPGVVLLWLAGQAYQRLLSEMLSSFSQSDPLAGKTIGKRLAWLKAQLS